MTDSVSTISSITKIAGRVSTCLNEWKLLTSDQTILNIVRGCKFDFAEMPKQLCQRETFTNAKEAAIIDSEISNLLLIGVVEKTAHSVGEFISTVFLRPKNDGTHRMILNLKTLNKSVNYVHFKMESLNSALQVITPNSYMSSLDIRHAYYLINVEKSHRKYLRFIWRGQLYEYTCLANGICSAPRWFTKLLKPVFGTLRSKGLVSVYYIDDTFLLGSNYQECQQNTNDTAELLERLGFIIHPEKSVKVPTQELVFLGFILNSVSMTIKLTSKKIEKIKGKIDCIRQKLRYTIRDVAEIVGIMVSYSVAVPLGILHTKFLEIDKIKALKECKGQFDAYMKLSDISLDDLNWWYNNVSIASAPIVRNTPTVELTTDASGLGWGAVFKDFSTGGHWSQQDLRHGININFLELHAVMLGLKCCIGHFKGKTVKINIDNTTAVACINNFGSTHSEVCNMETREIWKFASENNIWLIAGHLAGKLNVIADKESRTIRDETEWMLNEKLFQKLTDIYFKPSIDLFASRLNFQINRYVSWKPDPDAIAINAFTFCWSCELFYAFPPFSIIHQVAQKILTDKAEGLMIIPYWPTQCWFPILMKMCLAPPIKIKMNKSSLVLKHKLQETHPLYRKLTLLACHVSGKVLKNTIFPSEQFRLL